MTNRTIVECSSCGATILVRTQFGIEPKQEHKFPCSKCGIEISFVLLLDQASVSFEYDQLANASWVTYSEEALSKTVASVALNDDHMVPTGLPDMLSPFIAVFPNFIDIHQYREEEVKRSAIREVLWPSVQHLVHHYERNADDLFERELRKMGVSAVSTGLDRFRLITRLLSSFSLFVFDLDSGGVEIDQRFRLATNVDQPLVQQYLLSLHDTGKLREIWRQSHKVRCDFMSLYKCFEQVLQIRYWKAPPTDWGQFSASPKAFDKLRTLYIDSFETTCRLSVLAIALEAVIHHGCLELPTNNGSLTLEKYAKIPNANKWHYISRYPISRAFSAIDSTRLRNGIGHHSAYLDAENDTVVCIKDTAAGQDKWHIPYSEFVHLVLRQISAHFALDRYLHLAVASNDGSLQPTS
jgi:hypothetical protein